MAIEYPELDPFNSNNPVKSIYFGSGIFVSGISNAVYPDAPNSTAANVPTTLAPTTTSSTTTIIPTQLTEPSILPASGYYASFQLAMQQLAIPEFLSSAGWSDNARSFPQQTFLGASIRGFSMQGGFGDNSSSLTVELVVDEFNPSDQTDAGKGDDVYHSGIVKVPAPLGGLKSIGDNFVPPIPGSPVFFKFGPNFATVEEAYRKTFDDLYYYQTIPSITPTVTGGTSMSGILTGQANLPNNSYYDLDLDDATLVTQFPVDTALPGNIPRASVPRPLVNYSAIRNNPLTKGKDHIVFGGILQTYTQNRSFNGNPLYTVQVVDPREILSNATLILNDYAGPVHNLPNLINIYGFLEYELSETGKNAVSGGLPFPSILRKEVTLTQNGADIELKGTDKYYKIPPPEPQIDALREAIDDLQDQISGEKRKITDYRSKGDIAGADASYQLMLTLSQQVLTNKIQLRTLIDTAQPSFPITGTGFSRRSSQGIPYYRVRDAITALSEVYMPLPQEYKDQGFGGKVQFRGYNYAIDMSGLPELPEFYYLDFDQINLLELAQEICDVTNRDFFVSLLPVINHPACANLYAINGTATNENLIAGIIRIDTIDRSDQPFYGAVKKYIDGLSSQGIYVENQDVGYELSNVPTDKFVVGAQEVEMHYFSSNADRDTLAVKQTGRNGVFPGKPLGYEWTLEAALEQQILPYYGRLGTNAVTIPKGFGAYKQILLDSSALNAAGVKSYYVATEMELRCALISYERWKAFLLMYNDTYMDSIELDDTFDTGIIGLSPAPIGVNPPPPINISTTYCVTVPRSVFDTYELPINGSQYDAVDGLPISPCNPPYGYPLYFKRASKIGIPEAGLTNLTASLNRIQTNFAELVNASDKDVKAVLNSQWKEYQTTAAAGGLTPFEQQYFADLTTLLNDTSPKTIQNTIALLEKGANFINGGRNISALAGNIQKKNTKNALKVYNFIKAIAEECLGKKFLVKLPKEVNVFYSKDITLKNQQTGEYGTGPFGFKPRSTSQIYESSPAFTTLIQQSRNQLSSKNMMQSFLTKNTVAVPFVGALSMNFNPLSDKYESNYTPTNLGGYFHFDLYQSTLGSSDIRDLKKINNNALPPGVRQGLVPQDLTNFIDGDGRVSPYVRYDHSEDLTLEGFNDNDFTQQLITAAGMIPDLSEHLDNTGPDKFHSFGNPQGDANNNSIKSPQVAFVKCSVDETLYMPPKTIIRRINVHGQQVKDIGVKSVPQKIFIPCSGIEGGQLVPGTGVFVDSFTFYKANYVPLPVAGAAQDILDFKRYNPYLDLPGGEKLNNSEYVQGEYSQLDSEHVYALITMPNRVSPNKDSRNRDGNMQAVGAERFKHYMTMDVVRNVPGFNLPTNPPNNAPRVFLRSDVSPNTPPDARIHAWLAMKQVLKGQDFGNFDAQMNMSVPSPVYPDLVALPLISNDRCYGPWISSELDGQAYLLKNIGGKVDFIKDENLSPWNYGGYYLMNEAGTLMAEFSNSLLLFTERGGFTIPGLPQGNSLCRALINGGPLVTSINVDVSSGGIKTTYQMDLYTASFGKLQKQKGDEISKISRERKKLISERNALIRKGLGKNQNRRNFLAEINMMRAGVMPSLDMMGLGMANSMSNFAVSINRQQVKNWSSLGQAVGTAGAELNLNEYSVGGSVQNAEAAGQIAGNFISTTNLAEKMQSTAIASVPEIFSAASNGPHPILPGTIQRGDASNSILWDGGNAPDQYVG